MFSAHPSRTYIRERRDSELSSRYSLPTFAASVRGIDPLAIRDRILGCQPSASNRRLGEKGSQSDHLQQQPLGGYTVESVSFSRLREPITASNARPRKWDLVRRFAAVDATVTSTIPAIDRQPLPATDVSVDSESRATERSRGMPSIRAHLISDGSRTLVSIVLAVFNPHEKLTEPR